MASTRSRMSMLLPAKMTIVLLSWSLLLLIKYSSGTECHEDLFIDTNQILKYSGGPCTWNVTTKLGHYLEVTIKDFKLQDPFRTCQNTNLRLTHDDVEPLNIYLTSHFPLSTYAPASFALKLIMGCRTMGAKIHVLFRPVQDYYYCDFNKDEECTMDAIHASGLGQEANFENIATCEHQPHSQIFTGFVLVGNPTLQVLTLFLPAGEYEVQVLFPCPNGSARISSTCFDTFLEVPLNVHTYKSIHYLCKEQSNITIEAVEDFITIAIDFILIIQYLDTDLRLITAEPIHATTTSSYLEDPRLIPRTTDYLIQENTFSANQPGTEHFSRTDPSFMSIKTNGTFLTTTTVSSGTGSLIIYLSVSGLMVLSILLLGVILAIYIFKRLNKDTDKDDLDIKTTDLENHTYNQQRTFDQRNEQDSSYSEVRDGAISDPEYNYITYSKAGNPVKCDDGNMIYNAAYQSFEKSSNT